MQLNDHISISHLPFQYSLYAGHKLTGEELGFEPDVDECFNDFDVFLAMCIAIDSHSHKKFLTLLAKLLKTYNMNFDQEVSYNVWQHKFCQKPFSTCQLDWC